MCIVMLAHRPTPGTLLAVASNRNEFLARPAEPISPWPAEPGLPRVVAPRDIKAGGTWQGVNDRGLFVCLTNRRRAVVSADRESRGRLAEGALRLPSARAVHQWMGTLRADRFNGFHLLAADLEEAWLTVSDGARIERSELSRGVHVITERSFGAGEGAREEEARAAYQALFARGEPTVYELRRPMQLHAVAPAGPLESACVHDEARDYGTRSSLHLLVSASGPLQALWGEGPTCTAQPIDVAPLLQPFLSR